MKKALHYFSLVLLLVFCVGCEKDGENNYPGGGSSSSTNKNPTAYFTVNTGTNLTVNFTNQSVNADAYEWNFGDGQISYSTSPTHTYSTHGTKHVSLKASNGNKSNTFSFYLDLSSEIKLINDSENTYKIYIDGSYKGTIPGGGVDVYNVAPGNRVVEVKQMDGYTLYPTEEEYQFLCSCGQIYTRHFPDDRYGK